VACLYPLQQSFWHQNSLDYRGYHTVARLSQHGAHVYLCARNTTKGEAAIKSIKMVYPEANITLLEMNHLSLSSVVAAANIFLAKETCLHGLVNNAGIMATPFEMSSDGYEIQWQTNYLAHWVFTSHLLPILLKTSKTLPPGNVRIVNVASVGHYSAPKGGINFDDTSLKNEKTMARYGQSKLANVLHVKTLNKQFGPDSPNAKAGVGELWVTAVHPGLVQSNLGEAATEFPLAMRVVATLFGKYIAMEGDKGAWTSVFCAASPELKKENCGAYFQRIADPNGWQSSMAKDVGLANKLEVWTKEEMKKGGWIE
jgi:NAD(P)-dependent dehydrogenase (short-subunit alcohol dehydrogenase family)